MLRQMLFIIYNESIFIIYNGHSTVAVNDNGWSTSGAMLHMSVAIH